MISQPSAVLRFTILTLAFHFFTGPNGFSQNLLKGTYYVGVDGGVSYLQDANIRGSQLRKSLANMTDFKVNRDSEWDLGPRFGLMGGYHVTEDLAVELELGYIQNSADKFLGVSPGSKFSTQTANETISGKWFNDVDLYQVPILLNFVYRFPMEGSFHPFIGAGAGADIHTLSLGKASASRVGDQVYEVNKLGSESDTDVAFAAQAKVGLEYALTEQMEVDLSYKFLFTSDMQWQMHHDSFEAGPMYNHGILASFTYRF